jgi:predicted nucleic acid-binding protein
VIYLDSSALLKLVFDESESEALETWLAERPDSPLVSSEISRIEVKRAVMLIDPGAAHEARALLAGLDLVPLASDLVDAACDIGESHLRSLDAIHLATAWSLRQVPATLVAYDTRLLNSAAEQGLQIASPGQT